MSNEDRHITPATIERASEWYALLSTGDASEADHAAHMEWLLEDPSHPLAYEQVAMSMRNISSYETQLRTAFAKDLAPPAKTVHDKPFWSGWGWPQLATGLAAVAALLFVVIFPSSSFYDTQVSEQIYSADAGDVRNVKLADGSRVTLFAGSSISVRINSAGRNVDLLRGRGFFSVVSDSSRPFTVDLGSRKVRVVGTRFEVIKGENFDRVAVNEGLVAVSSSPNPELAQQAPLLIEPGTIALYRQGQNIPEIQSTPVEMIGFWTSGSIAFQDEPLATVVEKLQIMFPDTSIRIEDQGLASKRFSGSLVVSDLEEMLASLAAFLDLTVRKDSNGYWLDEARD
ncbi:FecR family protein [Kordiimonas gwangyangensis]|uniref:FecR family protein n=1 Tax=Kordiimonas gwangyangensis TaxID=288022 RepID=UPI000377BF0B|nr:FecR domain-containing protein [Kordiimonas gwangyangensis]